MNKTTNIKINSIISVYDGDTFRGRVNAWPDWLGDNVPFRIAGIDTPEMRGGTAETKALARKARDVVRDTFAQARDIRFDILGRGKYFRIICNVRADGEDIGGLLIGMGLARPYDGGTKSSW